MTGNRIARAAVAAVCSVLLVAAGALLVAPVAANALAGINWTSAFKHEIKPRADKVYAPKPKTIRGSYTVVGSGADGSIGTAISFGWTFDKAPKIHYIEDGATRPAACRGTVANPKAKPGHLCIYENVAINRGTPVVCASTNACGGKASPYGAMIIMFPTAASHVDVSGSWAATPVHKLTSKIARGPAARGGPSGR